MVERSKVSRRATIIGAAASAASAIMPLASARAAEPIRVGMPVALTGPLGGIGAQVRRSAEFWAKRVNAAGGLLGRPVELIVEDTAGNPSACVRKAEEMVERYGIRFLTGIVQSNEALAVAPRLAEWETIFVSSINGDGRLTAESLVPNFFRPNASGPMRTRAVSLYLRDAPQKVFYGIGGDYAWGHNSMDVFQEEIKRAGKNFAGSVFAPVGTKDFATYITSIRQSGADALYVVLSGDDFAGFMSQVKQYRLDDKVQIFSELVDQITINATGDSLVGLIGSWGYPSTYDTPANNAFVAAFKAELGVIPDVYDGDQYQACSVLQAGVEKAGTVEIGKVRAALEGLVIDSIKGRLLLRACDHQGEQEGFVAKIVKRAGMERPIPEVLATYPGVRVTPPCNSMTFSD